MTSSLLPLPDVEVMGVLSYPIPERAVFDEPAVLPRLRNHASLPAPAAAELIRTSLRAFAFAEMLL
jgi:hypothetical protein